MNTITSHTGRILPVLCLLLSVSANTQATCIATDSGSPENTITGCKAFSSNTTGASNTVNGYLAMQHNTTGGWNSAVGNLTM